MINLFCDFCNLNFPPESLEFLSPPASSQDPSQHSSEITHNVGSGRRLLTMQYANMI